MRERRQKRRALDRPGLLSEWGPQAWIDMWMSKRMLVEKAMPIVIEVERLREQNERMRPAMRRCLTCDDRLVSLEEARTPPSDSSGSDLSDGGLR